MKVILVPSPRIEEERPDILLPSGLISLATILRNADVDVEIVDINAIASDSTYNNVPEAIMAKDPDIVGFSTMCALYHITFRLARRCKELKRDVKILLGGPQATFSDRAALEAFPYVDVIVRGEAEGTIVQVIEALSGCRDLQEVPGITFQSQKGIVRNPVAPLIMDLDDLPDPAYDLFPSMCQVEHIYIEEGRGCPFGCSFCCTNEFWQRTLRMRSIDRFVGLIKKLTADYGNKKLFVFLHDTFNLSRDRVILLCETLKRENLNIQWHCDSRIDRLDEDLLRLMAEAGCTSIYFGIESGSERMQKLIGKKLILSRAPEIVNCITELGMNYTASFIIGFPDEKLEDLEQTINLAMTLRYDSGKCQEIQIHRLYPLTGSRLFKEYDAELEFDGNFYGFAYSSLCEEDFEMVRKYPKAFSAYHYFPTKYLDRVFLLRIHFIMVNLLYMSYTEFIFYKDEMLRFPRCLIEYHSLLDLPPNSQSKFGKNDTLTLIWKFLNALLHRLGIEEHPVREVMRYELAVKKVRNAEKSDTPMEVEEFNYDVEGLIGEIDANGFHRLPEFVRCERYAMLFTKKDEKVVTARLPVKLAQMLSSRSKSQEFI
jgi:radical SAM superfamily enzyme YgiQ (UPF0313 family)